MSNDVVQGLAVPLYYYIGRPPPLMRKKHCEMEHSRRNFLCNENFSWTPISLMSNLSHRFHREVIEVLAVFKTNLYLAPFDESLSNLIIYKNWIPLFIYYESAWNYVTQLDHFCSELFKIYLIGEEKAIHSISLKRLIPSFSQKKSLDAQYIDKNCDILGWNRVEYS